MSHVECMSVRRLTLAASRQQTRRANRGENHPEAYRRGVLSLPKMPFWQFGPIWDQRRSLGVERSELGIRCTLPIGHIR
jgi:hypothetical protein